MTESLRVQETVPLRAMDDASESSAYERLFLLFFALERSARRSRYTIYRAMVTVSTASG